MKKTDKKAVGKVDPRKVVAPPPLFDVADTKSVQPTVEATPVTPLSVVGGSDVALTGQAQPTPKLAPAPTRDEPSSLFDLN